MKTLSRLLMICAVLSAGILSLHLLGSDAYAAEGSSHWRPIYDLIMRWINFGIIVFVVYKYGRKPLMNFLRGRKEKVAAEIEELETRRDEMVAKIDQTQNDIKESDVRFAKLKERIIQQGEKKKSEIIESAQNHGKSMIADAKRRVDTHFFQAKNAFRSELIDKAVDMALERLPGQITAEDNEKFTREFLDGASAKQ
jgi:F-type H+-transporting ATPase subunit b